MELRGTADAVAVVCAEEVVVEGDVVVVAVVRVVAGWGVGGETVGAAAASAAMAVASSAMSFAIATGSVGALCSGVAISSALLGTIADTALSGVAIHFRFVWICGWCWMESSGGNF